MTDSKKSRGISCRLKSTTGNLFTSRLTELKKEVGDVHTKDCRFLSFDIKGKNLSFAGTDDLLRSVECLEMSTTNMSDNQVTVVVDTESAILFCRLAIKGFAHKPEIPSYLLYDFEKRVLTLELTKSLSIVLPISAIHMP